MVEYGCCDDKMSLGDGDGLRAASLQKTDTMPEIFAPGPSEGGGGFFKKIWRTGKWVVLFLVFVLLGLGGYLWWERGRAVPGETVAPESKTTVRSQANLAPSEASSEAEPLPLFGDGNYKSENFQVGEVAIGGEAEFLLSEDSPEPLAIEDVRGEAFTEKNKPEVRLVLSWKTNKLALSDVSYAKGVGQAGKTVEESDYSLSHGIVIPGLDQASTYVYTITSRDRYGNEVTSEAHAVYTGSRTVSLFDLIADAVGEVFGWAVKK